MFLLRESAKHLQHDLELLHERIPSLQRYRARGLGESALQLPETLPQKGALQNGCLHKWNARTNCSLSSTEHCSLPSTRMADLAKLPCSS